jgi:lipooligosaccharide transport system permease protein
MNGAWLFRWPVVGRRAWKVWRRDRLTFSRTWKTNLIPPLLEPILYLGAFGFGLGLFVGEIGGVSYAEFIAPALLAISMMTAAFFECTYASFVRMYYQRTFDAIIATPVNIDEVILGELLWGATKSTIYTVIVLAVVAAFGLVGSPLLLLAVPFSFLAGLMFAGLGMMFTAVSPSIDTLSYPTSLFITPMMLVSGTFFPLSVLPSGVQAFSLAAVPLVHAVNVCRSLSYGEAGWELWLGLAWVAVAALLATVASINMMRRRLIV